MNDSRLTVKTDCTLHHVVSLCIKIQKDSALVIPWISNKELLNYLGQKLTNPDWLLQPIAPFAHVFSICIKLENESDLVFPWISKLLLLNYLGQKVNEPPSIVTTDCTLRPCLPLKYQNSKRIGLRSSLNKQCFTLQLLRAKKKRIQIDYINRLYLSPIFSLYVSKNNLVFLRCLLFFYQISNSLDLVFNWNSNTFSSITKCWE